MNDERGGKHDLWTSARRSEAGPQRLQRALHQQGWQAEVSEALLWEEAERRRQELASHGETPLCIWDSSVFCW